MAYVPDYDHDVFVSYARLDDQGESAWVTNLVRHLDTELKQRLGTKDLRIWIDHSLDGNRPLTPEIMQAIRRSATLIVIVSPSYIASEWCGEERNAFLGFARDCVWQAAFSSSDAATSIRSPAARIRRPDRL